MSKTKSGDSLRARSKSKPPRSSESVRNATRLIESATDALLAATEADPGQQQDSLQQSLQPMLVRASAGTGKTYRLTARLLKILLQGAPPETILATTFTRKAAGEILDRVLMTLAEAADESNDEALDKLRQQVGIPTLPRNVCLQLLTKMLRNVHRLRICTLDSLFSQLARSFPLELGLPPTWRLTDEIEEIWLRERAVDSVISLLDPGEMVTMLSMLGKGDANRSIARELLWVVDAAYSIQRQCEPGAWNKLVAPTAPDTDELNLAVQTMRSVMPKQKRLLNKLRLLADQLEQGDFASLDKDTLISNIAAAQRESGNVRYYNSEFDAQCNEAFETLYAAVRTHVLALLAAQNDATGTILGAYDLHIMQLKHAARVMSFDDVTTCLARQFGALDQTVLENRMDGAINHLLLDEFQDTSPSQWQVLRPLAERCVGVDEAAANQSSRDDWQVKRSFFCVGDTKQAIYGWRGGVSEIFDAVTDQIDGIAEDEQNTSYRSSPVVIDVVNQTFKNLPRHPMAKASSDLTEKTTHDAIAIQRFAKHFPDHTAHQQPLPGFVRVQTCRKTQGERNEKDLAAFEDTAQLVSRIHGLAAHVTIGILTRTNRAVAQLIYLLERNGVDVSQEGGNPLTDSAAVELILSTLMMADHPGDGRWKFHVQSTPIGALPDFSGDFIRAMCEDRGLPETVEFLAGALAPICDQRDTLRLKQLTRLAMNYQLAAAPRLRDFVRMVREKRVERPRSAPVRVMTIHQAKGLEFDAVVLPQLDGQLTRQGGQCVAQFERLGDPPIAMTRYLNNKSWHFLSKPWQRAFGDQAASAMNEALCLMYVAMTRARQALHVIMQPGSKPEFVTRTPASLLYHALGCSEDPTQGSATLYESGDPNWFQADPDSSSTMRMCDERTTRNVAIQFRPLPKIPRRNVKSTQEQSE